MPSPRVIITADDFGLHPRVNEAVEQAHRYGTLTAASLMVTGPAALDAVRRARRLPDLRVGLHLVLADGHPQLPPEEIPALVNQQGRFGSSMVYDGLRFALSPRTRAQLAREIDAQFAAFAATGLALDHVNAHKHFHLHPTVLSLILRAGLDHGLRAVRLPYEPGGLNWLRPWTALMRTRLSRAGIHCNDQVRGIALSGRFDEAALTAVLARLPPGLTEIYLHPATAGPEPLTPTMREYRHADELSALLSPRVRAALAVTGARTGGFTDLCFERTP